MKNNLIFFKKKKLAVFWQGGKPEYFLFDKSKIIRLHSLRGIKPSETLLVIGRSGVIQKEMQLLVQGSLREGFENALNEILPSHKEMAYGSLAWGGSAREGKGLLYAIPEKKIREILEILTQAGISVDEIVTEDQCLSWFFQKRILGSGPVLVIDKTNDRTLFVVIKEKNAAFSGAYPLDHEAYRNAFSEISFSLLQMGLKPEKIILSGMNDEEKIKAGTFFQAPIEIQEGGEFQASVLGAGQWKEFPAASLLPKEVKLLKWTQNQSRRFKNFVSAAAIFSAVLVLSAVSHSFFLSRKNSAIEKEAQKLMPEASRLRLIAVSLNKIHQAENSKVRILQLFSDLAQGVSPSIRLKELQVNEKDIVLEGESPSHTLVSDTAQSFEKLKMLTGVKIEHTRMRKRLNQDYLEFEISAKWKEVL